MSASMVNLQPALSRRQTMTSTELDIPIYSSEWSREPVFPFIAVRLQQTRTPASLTTKSESNVSSFRSYSLQTHSIPTITVHLPDDAQINANGGLRRLLGDVKHTYRVKYRSFSEWSMRSPDQGFVFVKLVEGSKHIFQDVEAQRIELEDGYIGQHIDADEIWLRMVKWEIRETLVAMGQMEGMRREWEENVKCF